MTTPEKSPHNGPPSDDWRTIQDFCNVWDTTHNVSNESWDFSDEIIVSEFHRCIRELELAREQARELEAKIARLCKQHHDFIYFFGA